MSSNDDPDGFHEDVMAPIFRDRILESTITPELE